MYDWDGNCLCMDCVGPEPAPVLLCKHVWVPLPDAWWKEPHTCDVECTVCGIGWLRCLDPREGVPKCGEGKS